MESEQIGVEAHGDGENYFVSMTDMMVGMLFIFIIMLMSFALIFRQQTDTQEVKTKEQTGKIEVAEEIGRKLDELEREIDARLSELKAASELRRELLNRLRSELAAEQINVMVTPSGDVLRLTDDAVRFEISQSDLTPQATQNVDKIARVLARVLPLYATCRNGQSVGCRTATEASVETVFIEGHTDETGIDDNNWGLSAQRAASTYRELTRVAPELRQILNDRSEEILSISGYSSTRRLDSSGTKNGQAKNRRIDLRFVMETDPSAGLEAIGSLLRDMRTEIDKLRGAPQ